MPDDRNVNITTATTTTKLEVSALKVLIDLVL